MRWERDYVRLETTGQLNLGCVTKQYEFKTVQAASFRSPPK